MKRPKHTLPPPELELPHTLHTDRHRFEEVQVPIITISATFKSEIAEHFQEKSKVQEEVVLSRAHYSMAVGVFAAAKEKGLTTWLVDPMNYVSLANWGKVTFTEKLGEAAARIPLLKKLKDLVDSLVRTRLPVSGAVRIPIEYVSQRTTQPIISLHYEAGNLLAAAGRRVLQVVTDPHVRPQYLLEAQRPNITFAVFDEETKRMFLEKAEEAKKSVPATRVVVTGPPVDPRIVATRRNKKVGVQEKRELRLVIATGGLGTNMGEIHTVLESLLPGVKEKKLSLILYAGTHLDFRSMFYSLPKKHKVPVGDITTKKPVRVIYDESIIQANQELIEHAFPWADGFITKPSGDMAYDAAASGCFFLSLSPWGEWEENIANLFEGLEISQKADIEDFPKQLNQLLASGWVATAIQNARNIDPLFLNGAEKIVDLQRKLSVEL